MAGTKREADHEVDDVTAKRTNLLPAPMTNLLPAPMTNLLPARMTGKFPTISPTADFDADDMISDEDDDSFSEESSSDEDIQCSDNDEIVDDEGCANAELLDHFAHHPVPSAPTFEAPSEPKTPCCEVIIDGAKIMFELPGIADAVGMGERLTLNHAQIAAFREVFRRINDPLHGLEMVTVMPCVNYSCSRSAQMRSKNVHVLRFGIDVVLKLRQDLLSGEYTVELRCLVCDQYIDMDAAWLVSGMGLCDVLMSIISPPKVLDAVLAQQRSSSVFDVLQTTLCEYEIVEVTAILSDADVPLGFRIMKYLFAVDLLARKMTIMKTTPMKSTHWVYREPLMEYFYPVDAMTGMHLRIEGPVVMENTRWLPRLFSRPRDQEQGMKLLTVFGGFPLDAVPEYAFTASLVSSILSTRVIVRAIECEDTCPYDDCVNPGMEWASLSIESCVCGNMSLRKIVVKCNGCCRTWVPTVKTRFLVDKTDLLNYSHVCHTRPVLGSGES